MSEPVTICAFGVCTIAAIRNSIYCTGHTKLFGQKPVKPESKIPKVSEKGKLDLKQYEKKRKEFLKRNAFCKAKVVENCSRIAMQIHHQKGRLGENLLDEKTWLPVCPPCHAYLETHVIEAKSLNLSKNRLSV